jgi:predicted nucleic acid-binding protein
VLIDHLRALAPATDYIAALDEQPACSEVSRIEIIQGLRSAGRSDAETLFSLIEWIPVTEQIARRAGALGRRWRASHPGIGIADLAVAATAEHLATPLATRNVKHFPMFAGLQAPY